MKKNKKYSAFTLVELIIVITILTILGTIAFVSLQWYSKSARDSRKVGDINNIKTSLELFILNTWYYPTPDNPWIITYSWETVWTQWTVWDNVTKNLSRNLQYKPKDILLDIEYTYSLASSKKEYQLMALYEWDISYNNFFNKSYAANSDYNIKLDWIYNEIFVKTPNYIIPLPSLVTSEQLPLELKWWTKINSMVLTNWTNFPNLNISNTITLTWQLSFSALNVYDWSITNQSSTWVKLLVYQAIFDTYSGSSIENNPIIKELLSKTTDEDKIEFTNIVVLNNTPTVTSNTTIDTSLITSTDCTNTQWIWVDSSTDVYIWTSQWSWFCISPIFWDWQTNWQDQTDWAWSISWNGWWNNTNDITNWWDQWSIDDTWTPSSLAIWWQTKILDSEVSYNCKSLWTSSSDYDTKDNIVWRMKWLAVAWNTYANARSIEWITWLVPHTVWTYPHAIPALYIADCIDWVKDLWTDMLYKHYPDENLNETITYAQYSTNVWTDTNLSDLSGTTYQNRQKYLTAWTQKTGSHLPSAMSYISDWFASASDGDWNYLTDESRWEYQVACDAGKMGTVIDWWSQFTWANDNTNKEWIKLSAIGDYNGTGRGHSVRIVGRWGCGQQDSLGTVSRQPNTAARFVVRP